MECALNSAMVSPEPLAKKSVRRENQTDMSIATKRGDKGETDLLFGCRLSKSHPRVHALGAVDELNAALGLLRVSALRMETEEFVGQIGKDFGQGAGGCGECARLANLGVGDTARDTEFEVGGDQSQSVLLSFDEDMTQNWECGSS